jgi:hypothetical protein
MSDFGACRADVGPLAYRLVFADARRPARYLKFGDVNSAAWQNISQLKRKIAS